MKVLIIGNHTCGNRGDGAIIRGLIEELEQQIPNIELELMSRFPISSEILLSRPFRSDWLYKYQPYSGGLKSKIKNRIHKPILLERLISSARSGNTHNSLPIKFKEYIKELQGFDYVIQVGGSFFVDLYGVGQFHHALCALTAKVPLLILGHSVGPFENDKFCEVSELVFSRAKVLGLRESVSKSLLEEKFELPECYVEGADTAWLVKNDVVEIENKSLIEFIERNKTVAITLRELKPFDKRLNVTQEEYERSFATLCNSLIEEGYQILACSTCTGIEGYQKDDRMVAFKVGKLIKNPEMFKIVMDELNDVELGTLIGKCTLTIGTRLHSAIISMNFGTPAFALNYEHKSEGIMNQLGLPHFGVPISMLIDGVLIEKVRTTLGNVDTIRQEVAIAVEKEKERARNMILSSLK